jgi:hypothetical protein
MAKRKPTKQSQPITGRDAYIMSQALVFAIGHIQRFPPKQQQWSNMVDMCRLARTYSQTSCRYMWSVSIARRISS